MRIYINESFDCDFAISMEIKEYAKKFSSAEQLLRNGGIPTKMLDRMAFGFDDTLSTIHPSKLTIKWQDDLENVKWEINRSKLSPQRWASTVSLEKPIDVSYDDYKFYLEDGHHRYMAAKILDKNLNMSLEIKMNPIVRISDKSYDDFHKCVWKIAQRL